MKFRKSIVFYINAKKYEISGEKCFLSLADFLRYDLSLKGTKIVCAEGDCGACTVLLASIHELDKKNNKFKFKSVNSCILPLLAVDGCQIVSVEGLKCGLELHPVQKSMLDHFSSQCGYCTPGFACSMTSLLEDSILYKKAITEKRAKNYMTGNLCRCTGYDPIIKSAVALPTDSETLQKRYSNRENITDLKKCVSISVEIMNDETSLFLPTSIKQALQIKQKYQGLRVVAGATDLGVAVNKGRAEYQHIMSLQNISALWQIKKSATHLEIPARVTLSILQKYIKTKYPEMDQALNIFASPQIKNTATLVGNIVNASPIGDTIPFLMVQDAIVQIESVNGKRLVPIHEFYLGYKKVDLKRNELVTAILLPLPNKNEILKLYKVSLRKDLDISAVTLATRIRLKDNQIIDARIAFGGVGPTVLRLKAVEKMWLKRLYDQSLFSELAFGISKYVTPISDVRGSKEYRMLLCRNLLLKIAAELI